MSPHESFSSINYFGGLSTFFVNLTQQLSNYNEFGPPKLPHVMMSQDDLKFAKAYKEWEIENVSVDTIPDDDCFFDIESNNLICFLCSLVCHDDDSRAWMRAAQQECV